MSRFHHHRSRRFNKGYREYKESKEEFKKGIKDVDVIKTASGAAKFLKSKAKYYTTNPRGKQKAKIFIRKARGFIKGVGQEVERTTSVRPINARRTLRASTVLESRMPTRRAIMRTLPQRRKVILLDKYGRPMRIKRKQNLNLGWGGF